MGEHGPFSGVFLSGKQKNMSSFLDSVDRTSGNKLLNVHFFIPAFQFFSLKKICFSFSRVVFFVHNLETNINIFYNFLKQFSKHAHLYHISYNFVFLKFMIFESEKPFSKRAFCHDLRLKMRYSYIFLLST